MNCPTCKVPVPAGMQKCANCGTPLAFTAAPGAATAAPNQPPGAPYVGARRNSNLAVISVALASLSWIGFGPLTAVPAVITGHMAKKEIQRSNGALGGEGLATAGLVIGYLTIAMTVLLFSVWISMIQSMFSG